MNLSYIIHLLPILLNAYKKIHDKIRNKREAKLPIEQKINEKSINIHAETSQQAEYKDVSTQSEVESGLFSRVKHTA